MNPTKDTEKCCPKCNITEEYGTKTRFECHDSKCECHVPHTKEDTDWVEEQIKELSCTYIPDGQPENYLKKEMLEKIRTILLAAKEKYISEGKEQAEFENKKLQEMTAYQLGYDQATSIKNDGTVHPFFQAYGERMKEIGVKQGRALREKEILAALPNDNAVREWAENLTQEADKAWYASGAVWMRLKIRQIITKPLE